MPLQAAGLIVKETTTNSVNTFAEWFCAGFERVTGTSIVKKKRSDVYNLS